MDMGRLAIMTVVLIAVFALLAAGIALIFFGNKTFRSGLGKNKFFKFETSDKVSEEAQKIFDSFPDAQKIFEDIPNIFGAAPGDRSKPDAQDSGANNQQAPDSKK